MPLRESDAAIVNLSYDCRPKLIRFLFLNMFNFDDFHSGTLNKYKYELVEWGGGVEEKGRGGKREVCMTN